MMNNLSFGQLTSRCYKFSVNSKDDHFCPLEWLVPSADECVSTKHLP
uniref:Macaca fascicularis brain cDNA clone: QorA-13568, similar to human salt-inducible serine/threonine kinase 2 (SIK2), mRNA, RefSeq: NM_015191.1 n=1 Tax=Macaca fascicularis TaxID=9541 RepID=I7G3R4_MACFA|nr:unnamed protein product [Macaca fascicularis]